MKILSNPIWRKGVSFFLAILILVFTTSCNYYQVRWVKAEALPSLSEIGKIANYFILNQGGTQFQLTQITLGEDYLKAHLDSLSQPVYYSGNRRGREYKYEEKSIVHEVHVFLKDSTAIFTPGTDVVIPLADLKKIGVIDPDTGLTVIMYFLVGLGVASAALVIAMIIWLATKSSCPYVYANNGETFVMEGEIYSGAIFKGLERHDYLPLPNIQPVDNTYELRIANELKEQQHTNLANLIVVNHPEGSRVLMDQDGIPYLLIDLVSPQEAYSEKGQDLHQQMAFSDRDVFLFNEEEADTNRLYLTFQKPQKAAEGVLVLNLKNTLWGDFVYGEFSKKMGYFYSSFIQIQNQKSPIELNERGDKMGFPLRIFMETEDGWELVQKTSLIGPLVDRDIAVPVDLSRVKGKDVHLRLESGFMFWEVDQAAMSFSGKRGLEMLELKPLKAISTAQSNARASLSEDDALYLDQWETGDVTEISFEAPPVPEGYLQTCFLHSKGYYNHVREFANAPEYAELTKFKEPGYFDIFSRELYRRIKDGPEELISSN